MPAATPPAPMWWTASAQPLPGGESRPVCSPIFKLGGALKVPGLSGRRCEDRGVRHPRVVVALTDRSACDSLPVDHVDEWGLLPEIGLPVRHRSAGTARPLDSW